MYNILCVDDTQTNLFVLESLFETKSDRYTITSVTSGEDALGVLLQKQIDLILLDVMMPDMDGFQTAQLISTNKQTKDIPIIFLTAKRDDTTIQKAFSLGVDYLSKPYDEFELLARVEFHIKLVEYKDKLKEQIAFSQSVMDAQQTIIFIYDEHTGIVSVNKRFLEFFAVDSLEEFNTKHDNISNLFMEYENYFSLHVLNNNKPWTQYLANHSGVESYKILLMDISTFEPKAFQINVNPIDNRNKFVVTLTDVTQLATQMKTFENKATYDNLTKVYNRSKFIDLFEIETKKAKDKGYKLAFGMFDIDHFKKVNDTYGHLVGDKTLITFASTINESIREIDIFARWGGEEFTILLPNVDEKELEEILNQIRIKISQIPFEEVGHITCSIGATIYQEGEELESLSNRADEGLYIAKETGRNKVVIIPN